MGPHRDMGLGGGHGRGDGGDRRGFDGDGPRFRGTIAAERMLRHAAGLNLTDDQMEKLETLAYETQKALVDLHSEIEKEQLEIQNIFRSGSDDLTLIKRHVNAVSKARADIQEARIVNLFEARKILTADQKKLVKEKHPRLGMILD